MPRWSRLCACSLAALGGTLAFGQELRTTPLAEAFAAGATLYGMRLSPDGARTVHIQNLADGTVAAVVIHVAAGTEQVLAVGGVDSRGVESCEWANASRLLCTETEGVAWITDGDGAPRHYAHHDGNTEQWFVREARGAKCTLLHERNRVGCP